ncbi:MAG: tRNA (N(6)-L-threonylcarbamoyladenosine(37)-C(2))-methylthiotransferase [Candidatus Micrarchaeia archaeon]
MQTYIKTYGCTLNHADSDIMASLIQSTDIGIAPSEDKADVVILNTCTVKKQTEQKILYALDKLVKEGKNVVVTGCMASANRDLIVKHAPNAPILTTSNTDRIVEALLSMDKGAASSFTERRRIDKASLIKATGSIVARVPASEGCLSNCTFCETKLARGPLNSFPEDTIARAVEYCSRNGSKEIEITSQDLGAYGFDRKTDISKLMKRIARVPGNFKVRIGMLNPEHLHKYLYDLIEAINDDKFYKFIHIPIQSGSDKVLSDMRRSCSTESFAEYVKELRKGVPRISIETDIIVGYPTESDSDFDMTLDMIKDIKPDITNISRFGARPNTIAAKLKPLDPETVNRRSSELSRLVRSVQNGINAKYIGKKVNALLTESSPKSLNGKTDSYKQVVLPEEPSVALGTTISASIYAASANALYGSVRGI